MLFVLTALIGCSEKEGPALSSDSVSPDSAQPTQDTSSAAGAADSADSAQDAAPAPAPAPTVKTGTVFAIVGDYGSGGPTENAVAAMVAGWHPQFIVTTGDNYLSSAGGGSGTAKYDASVGAYYGAWLKDISTTGTRLPKGTASVNSFFPALGEHDYTDAKPGPQTYLDYFSLPGAGLNNTSGNERYYDFAQGPVHFYVLDSNPKEPDGTSVTSKQAQWLQNQLGASTARWKIVIVHDPPYSSDAQRSQTKYMQWPFAAWGASGVVSGRSGTYERIMSDGIAYMVNGLGGAPRQNFRKDQLPGTVMRFNRLWGAQKVTISDTTLDFEFYSVDGTMVDRYTMPIH